MRGFAGAGNGQRGNMHHEHSVPGPINGIANSGYKGTGSGGGGGGEGSGQGSAGNGGSGIALIAYPA